MNSVFHPYTGSNHTQATASENQRLESERPSGIPAEMAERQQQIRTFIEKRNNVVIFLAIPLFALVYWLFFIRSGVNYAEQLVAQVFFCGFYSLATLALLVPLKSFFPNGNTFAGVQLLLQFLYLTFAYYQFQEATRKWRLPKAALATLLALLAWTVFSFAAVYIYIRYGG